MLKLLLAVATLTAAGSMGDDPWLCRWIAAKFCLVDNYTRILLTMAAIARIGPGDG